METSDKEKEGGARESLTSQLLFKLLVLFSISSCYSLGIWGKRREPKPDHYVCLVHNLNIFIISFFFLYFIGCLSSYRNIPEKWRLKFCKILILGSVPSKR